MDRYDPLERVLSLRQLLDRLMEDAVVVPGAGQRASADGAALDVYEEGDKLVVEAALPGVKPEDIQVTVEGGTLTIRAESTADQERNERNYLVREHRHASVQRALRLPESVDADAVQAAFDNGELRLTFPKSKVAQPRRIEIKANGAAAELASGATSSGS
jgi:HSP20 family protein